MKKIIESLLKLQTIELASATDTKAGKQLPGLRAEIPAQILAHYDRLMARGKKGVAIVRHQVCSECHVQVPRNSVLILMHGEDIQICENCGRYLCLPEDVIPETPVAKIRKAPAKKGPQLQTV